MKILILTTNTDHHLFFVNKLKEKFENISVILEKKKTIFHLKLIIIMKKKEKNLKNTFFLKIKILNLKMKKLFMI